MEILYIAFFLSKPKLYLELRDAVLHHGGTDTLIKDRNRKSEREVYRKVKSITGKGPVPLAPPKNLPFITEGGIVCVLSSTYQGWSDFGDFLPSKW